MLYTRKYIMLRLRFNCIETEYQRPQRGIGSAKDVNAYAKQP